MEMIFAKRFQVREIDSNGYKYANIGFTSKDLNHLVGKNVLIKIYELDDKEQNMRFSKLVEKE